MRRVPAPVFRMFPAGTLGVTEYSSVMLPETVMVWFEVALKVAVLTRFWVPRSRLVRTKLPEAALKERSQLIAIVLFTVWVAAELFVRSPPRVMVLFETV